MAAPSTLLKTPPPSAPGVDHVRVHRVQQQGRYEPQPPSSAKRIDLGGQIRPNEDLAPVRVLDLPPLTLGVRPNASVFLDQKLLWDLKKGCLATAEIR